MKAVQVGVISDTHGPLRPQAVAALEGPDVIMTRRVDFSAHVDAYDRRHGAALPTALAQTLARKADIGRGALVLDVGAGTGRNAVALAGIGCRVVGLDPSRSMLDELRRKGVGLPVTGLVGEGAHLPFPTACFDAVVLARVLFLMPEWQQGVSEVVRVLKPAGAILHEWGNGSADEPWVQVRETLRTLFERAGVKDPFHPGVRTEEEVHEFLVVRGLDRVADVRIPGNVSMTLAEFLRRIVDGECSYTWDVPADIQGPCLGELRDWTTQRFELDRLLPIPRELGWKIYRRRHVT